MQIALTMQEDVFVCIRRLEELEKQEVLSIREALEWNDLLNALLVWEQDHPGSVPESWSQR